jgi:Flp pilus assembly pilin Flp
MLKIVRRTTMKLNRRGQTLVEYVLIISLITVLAIGLVKIFGGYLKDKVTEMSCEIVGKEYVEGSSVGGGYCEGDLDKEFK